MLLALSKSHVVWLKTAALRPNLSISFLQKLNQATNEEQVRDAAVKASQLDINTVYAVKQSGAIGVISPDRYVWSIWSSHRVESCLF